MARIDIGNFERPLPFQDGPGLHFECEIIRETIDWWEERFGQQLGHTPRSLAEYLSRDLPGPWDFTYKTLDHVTDKMRVQLIGGEDVKNYVWVSDQEITLNIQCYHGYNEVRRDRQGQNLAKPLMRNSAMLAEQLGISLLRLKAIDIGAYAWGQFGFLPDYKSWNGTVRGSLYSSLEMLKRDNLISREQYYNVREILDSDLPGAFRLIMLLDDAIYLDSGNGRVKTTLAKALLINSGATWDGELDLTAKTTRDIFWKYVGRGA